jgi:hypothetical protein
MVAELLHKSLALFARKVLYVLNAILNAILVKRFNVIFVTNMEANLMKNARSAGE